ncbi:MerR family DNA-binding transcriptional regulator [Actinoallomurus bryophytorum]|uniref:MerR family DNA-binding transcriptional regulator n=1 Tax=Actinoallomurus bryophytorum TaxID=1490222 RepID=UPI001FE689BC|nr:MerR family DNA-binding transcriptional regulator [Actinoallomurus bryophytorum]
MSTQQVRNYEDAGVLPPVPRTAGGYRRFADSHRRAADVPGPGEGLWTARGAGDHACGPRR